MKFSIVVGGAILLCCDATSAHRLAPARPVLRPAMGARARAPSMFAPFDLIQLIAEAEEPVDVDGVLLGQVGVAAGLQLPVARRWRVPGTASGRGQA